MFRQGLHFGLPWGFTVNILLKQLQSTTLDINKCLELVMATTGQVSLRWQVWRVRLLLRNNLDLQKLKLTTSGAGFYRVQKQKPKTSLTIILVLTREDQNLYWGKTQANAVNIFCPVLCEANLPWMLLLVIGMTERDKNPNLPHFI